MTETDDIVTKATGMGIEYDFYDGNGKKKHHKTVKRELSEAIERTETLLEEGELPIDMPIEMASRELELKEMTEARPAVPEPEPDTSDRVIGYYRDGHKAWMTEDYAKGLVRDELLVRYEKA